MGMIVDRMLTGSLAQRDARAFMYRTKQTR